MARELNDLLCPVWRDGQAVYRGYEPGEIMAPLVWPAAALPLPWFCDFDEFHGALIKSVERGADLWNREIGHAMLKRVDDAAQAVVLVTWGGIEIGPEGRLDSGIACTSHRGVDGPASAVVSFIEAADVYTAFIVAAHEFGHVLGLDDDPSRTNSVMYPTIADQSGVDDPAGQPPGMTFVCPSDHDRALLRRMYG
jgi:hypothetical protein